MNVDHIKTNIVTLSLAHSICGYINKWKNISHIDQNELNEEEI